MNTGFDIKADVKNMEFIYGEDVYGPITEKRKLDDIRQSLSDPNVEGPKYVYAVAMDVAKKEHRQDLINRNLLYGAMIFGAWCVRDYGFDYDDVRAHNGVAYFPKVKDDHVVFVKNNAYQSEDIIIKEARSYPEFHLKQGIPIYTQYEHNRDLFTFVTQPQTAAAIWENFEP